MSEITCQEEILKLAKNYKADMTRFLRDMIAIPSETCDEKRVVLRIKEEMGKVGFDKVEIDKMGNILGYIGHGKHVIAMDAHIDTVGIGDINNWTNNWNISNSTLKDEMITFEDSAKYLIENHITTQEEYSLLEGI